jgi:hypothetical protein
MSVIKPKVINPIALIIVIARITGKSELLIALTIMLPRPGILKKFSANNRPKNKNGI